jgi:hypothetical protein
MINGSHRSNDANKRLDVGLRRRRGDAPLWLANQITPM